MQFDELDKKVQEAAERFHPVYDEQAWGNMENLLEKNLPQKREKKRVVWLRFLLLLIVGGIALFFWIKPVNKQDAIASPNKIVFLPNNDLEPALKTIATMSSGNKKITAKKLASNSGLPQELFAKTKQNSTTSHQFAERHSTVADKHFSLIINQPVEQNGSLPLQKTKAALIIPPTDLSPVSATEKELTAQSGKASLRNHSSEVKEENNFSQKADRKLKPSDKKQNSFLNTLTLYLSAGADVSAVNLKNIGKPYIVYGAGIGYRFSQNWKVRTGFFVAKKVYAAKANDYHPPAKFWTAYPNLDDIKADCKVFEVPIVVDYTFKNGKAHSYFASAGLSSYFMKKETYQYFSEPSAGNYRADTMTLANANTHYLSSVRFSAGYEKKLSNKISFIVEPYLNLPLSGVGYGKVKLNNAGALFTLSLKP